MPAFDHPAAEGAPEPRGLEASHRHAREVTRHHAKSFYFASVALPQHRRRAAYAVYAFCRHADDVVDEAETAGRAGTTVRAAIESLGAGLDLIFAGRRGEVDWPFAPALAAAVQEFGLPRQAFDELLEGVLMDLRPRVRAESWEELRRYCYHVASTVGLIMCPLLGLRDPAGRERAIDLGIAMQLTNILRDVGEDLGRDRIYLPAEELERFGLGENDLAAGEVTAAWRGFMRFQIRRARDYYARSEPGIRLLAADGSQLTVWLMHQVYGDILRQIERQDYQVFRRRAATGLGRKLWLAVRAWRRSRVTGEKKVKGER